MESTIPYRTLGRIGERVSAIGLGGWHLGLKHVDEQLSVQIIRTAIDRGINFLDNCWDYNDGASETRMGKALLDGYRQKVFLMTKIDGRSYAEATRQLDTSLERLRTDCIDLVQHHEILRYDDPHRIFDDESAGALRDALAGFTLAAMNVPQALGYTRIAGMPVVTGIVGDGEPDRASGRVRRPDRVLRALRPPRCDAGRAERALCCTIAIPTGATRTRRRARSTSRLPAPDQSHQFHEIIRMSDPDGVFAPVAGMTEAWRARVRS